MGDEVWFAMVQRLLVDSLGDKGIVAWRIMAWMPVDA